MFKAIKLDREDVVTQAFGGNIAIVTPGENDFHIIISPAAVVEFMADVIAILLDDLPEDWPEEPRTAWINARNGILAGYFQMQEKIARNVADRGYFEGWTGAQLLARQLVKNGEELGEAVNHVRVDVIERPWWHGMFEDVATIAREAFDNKEDWAGVTIEDPEVLAGELADMQVTLCVAAKAYEMLTGRRFDLMHEALIKSIADVERGRRE